ncbi:biotin--[acetyl-CoA-carboxylase] ligase [Microbacterium saperdae]|uniref:biotin--[biotin carboxyl-carrier protein] ligase n=1 Tax=Microbacterium saperdae TaxID=69368 RepID=A0A543BPD4_9MICO|nr:biotin--[acetyl-CoA-carboxylase] ligase [Microbacterium saperdae]TQL86686.1 BirA family biotin operon repressor/biotin-[acetyl-CoA-carboxylase] ligase [Microbacterium saperdae]GGM46132.1 biotin--[acetyl-CoA-carboxylase] ligase [Microbacterium saperdae]
MRNDLPRTREIAARLDVLAESGSTNAELRSRAANPEDWPHLSVLLTDNQTAGRGRLDRTWLAPAGSALAISVLLRALPANPTARGWIPLLAGVAMADAIAAQLPDQHVAVKWPNDVLVDERKICGILAEASGDAVVVGSGVNTAMTAQQLPVTTATSFAVAGVTVDDDRLIADYLRELGSRLSALAATGDAVVSGLHAAVTARCATLGRRVRVSLPGDQTLDGLATGLDADGRLLVDVDGVVRAISAGDVVHVRPA